jgi:hypothetical protein
MTNERTLTLVALLCGAGAPLACSGSGAVNIGNTNAIGSQLSDYAATWDGYAEAYTFTPDGSDRVRLTITGNGQGTFEVGNAALLPAPTDPNAGYPAGQPDPLIGPNQGLSGGMLYPVYAAQVQEDRIQAGLKPNDYYGAWCALQTPYYIINGYVKSGVPDAGNDAICAPYICGATACLTTCGGNTDCSSPNVCTAMMMFVRPRSVPNFVYSCLPGAGGGISGQGSSEQCSVQVDATDGSYSDQSVDCGKLALCTRNVCTCTASSCAAGPVVPAGTLPSGYPVELDAALDSTGKTLTGTLALSTDLRVTVVLTKQ